MAALFLIVFVGMMGTSLLAPLIPFYAARLGLTPEYITAIIGLYALCQFVAAPTLGQISDRWGRKPVLLITSLGQCIAFIMLAFADTIWLLVLSRMIGGVCAGNLATAYAYVTDTTTPENRASGMGKVGAAFGLGFVLGPALGGLLAGGDLMTANFVRPALAAAAIAAIAFLCAAFFLTESRKPDAAAKPTSLNPLGRFDVVMGNRALMLVLALAFLLLLASSVREATIALWVHDQFKLSSQQLGFLFAYTGLIITVLQGAVLGRLAKKFGEENVLIVGIIAYAVGLGCFVALQSYVSLIIGTTLNAIGTAIFSNALPTVATKLAAAPQRGLVLGVYQSIGSLSRFIGPSFAGLIYANVAITAPFGFGVVILVIGLILAFVIRRRIKA